MRPDDQLERLMADLESDLVGRKESLPSKKDKIYQSLCAFMNDMPAHGVPGVLFIGVQDDGVQFELLHLFSQCQRRAR